jgi:hypothetical protein
VYLSGAAKFKYCPSISLSKRWIFDSLSAVMTTRAVRGVPPEFPYIAARVIKSTTGAGSSGASG